VIFNTQIHGIACQCRVISYRPYVPATHAAEAMPSEFEFELLAHGRPSAALEAMCTEEVMNRLQDEYEAIVKEENDG